MSSFNHHRKFLSNHLNALLIQQSSNQSIQKCLSMSMNFELFQYFTWNLKNQNRKMINAETRKEAHFPSNLGTFQTVKIPPVKKQINKADVGKYLWKEPVKILNISPWQTPPPRCQPSCLLPRPCPSGPSQGEPSGRWCEDTGDSYRQSACSGLPWSICMWLNGMLQKTEFLQWIQAVNWCW